MSNNLSEEEIIDLCNFCLQGEYITAETEKAIQGLLDLYKKEKEKNKQWEDKIKETIKKYEEELKYEITRNEAKIIIKVLENLLKENQYEHRTSNRNNKE